MAAVPGVEAVSAGRAVALVAQTAALVLGGHGSLSLNFDTRADHLVRKGRGGPLGHFRHWGEDHRTSVGDYSHIRESNGRGGEGWGRVSGTLL